VPVWMALLIGAIVSVSGPITIVIEEERMTAQ
jgi:hypothetical protein